MKIDNFSILIDLTYFLLMFKEFSKNFQNSPLEITLGKNFKFLGNLSKNFFLHLF